MSWGYSRSLLNQHLGGWNNNPIHVLEIFFIQCRSFNIFYFHLIIFFVGCLFPRGPYVLYLQRAFMCTLISDFLLISKTSALYLTTLPEKHTMVQKNPFKFVRDQLFAWSFNFWTCINSFILMCFVLFCRSDCFP